MRSPKRKFSYLRASGINIPLFGLRTERDWGCGSFIDIRLLADACVASGIGCVQLLPVNDTYTGDADGDSYPYSPVSSIALDLKYGDIAEIAAYHGKALDEIFLSKARELSLLSVCDHAAVYKLKFAALQDIYNEALTTRGSTDLRSRRKFRKFRKKERAWLKSYAAFAAGRNAIGAEIDARFYEWVQFHLFRQLRAAKKYAGKKGIMLKGDLTVGIDRASADVAERPELFHLHLNAGAPPDAFSIDGQNWKFPVFNMPAMEAEGFKWFRRRMKKQAKFFHALRVDHVIGFLRIWSIPVDEPLGRNGFFTPADEAVWESEGRKHFKMIANASEMLLCGEDLGMVPPVTRKLMQEIGMLSLKILQMSERFGGISDPLQAPADSVVMPATHDMPPLVLWWQQSQDNRFKLLNLLDESVAAEDSLEGGVHSLPAHVALKTICRHLDSPAALAVFLFQDLFSFYKPFMHNHAETERINDPANPEQIWNWRMKPTVEAWLADKTRCAQLKKMNEAAGRKMFFHD